MRPMRMPKQDILYRLREVHEDAHRFGAAAHTRHDYDRAYHRSVFTALKKTTKLVTCCPWLYGEPVPSTLSHKRDEL